MPRPRIHELPLTAAERQARRRAKLRQPTGPDSGRGPSANGLDPPAEDRLHGPRPSLPARRLPPRPRRWAAAAAALIALQDEYRGWLDNLPDNLEGSRLADKLQAIAELDLEELQAIDPPRGYGRD